MNFKNSLALPCSGMFFSFAFLALTGFVNSKTSVGQTNEFDQKQLETVNSWSSFRNGGQSEIVDSTELPKQWSPESGIGWKVELPGYGQSSPVIMGDSIIVTMVDGDLKERNMMVCLSRKTGKTKWTVSRECSLPGPSNYMFSRAAPTPLVDSNRAFALFESGDLVAVDLQNGKIAWERNLADEVGVLKSRHGLASSPAQSENRLFINLEHDGPSALLAIEKENGKTAWKTERPSGSSWSSPVHFKSGMIEQVILSSQGNAVGLNAASGEQLWQIDGLAGNTVPSPTIDGKHVFLGARQPRFGSAEKAANSNLCLDFGLIETAPKVKWRSARCVSEYASPITCGDYLYLINKGGVLSCLNKATGQRIYRQRLGFECWATPVSNGTHLWVFGKNGAAVVIRAGDTFDKVAENHLWQIEHPPRPVSYREYFPPPGKKNRHATAPSRHGHSGKGNGTKSQDQTDPEAQPDSRILEGLLNADRDGDGFLSGAEIPNRFASALDNIDQNKDGKIDKAELAKMSVKIAARRTGSRENSRDPIVYGVAADSNGFLLRTGTRLFSISREDVQ